MKSHKNRRLRTQSFKVVLLLFVSIALCLQSVAFASTSESASEDADASDATSSVNFRTTNPNARHAMPGPGEPGYEGNPNVSSTLEPGDGVVVTFVNEPIKRPDLYISKEVEVVVDEQYIDEVDLPTGEEEFTFRLKVNGKDYNGEDKTGAYYAVNSPYDRSSPWVISEIGYGDDDDTGLPDGFKSSYFNPDDGQKYPYKTDRYGRFTLRVGETALFMNVGYDVTFEVVEEEMEGFVCVPSTGVIKGHIGETAESITFVNKWIPTIEGVTSLPTTLRVEKELLFPEGFTPPKMEFKFAVTVDDAPFAGEPYTVYNADTYLQVSEGYTDANGCFTMGPNCYADLATVPSNLEYKVEEVIEEDSTYHAVGPSVSKGPTVFPMTYVSFTNVEATLAVYKTVKGDSGAIPFTFRITDAASKAVSGAKYYLYSTGGVGVDDEVHTTTELGKFTLQQNQAAIFIGLSQDTTYNIVEESTEGYTCSSPGPGGYTGIEVTDDPLILSFENEPFSPKGDLLVLLTVDVLAEVSPPSNDPFPLKLEVKEDGKWVPVPDAVFSISTGSNSTISESTDTTGQYLQQDQQIAVFSNLPLDKDYRISEDLFNHVGFFCRNENNEEIVHLTKAGASVTIVNSYDSNRYGKLQFVKRDSMDDVLIPNAGFMLYSDEACTTPLPGFEEAFSNTKGVVVFDKVPYGTSYLKETTVPELYRDDSVVYKVISDIDIATLYKQTDEGEWVEVNCVYNTVAPLETELPSTGGSGVVGFYVAGMLLLIGATFVSLHNKKRTLGL